MAMLHEANLSDGDPIKTAALAAALQQDNTIDAIGADLQVAADYKTYLANTAAINQLLALYPDSAFATGWELTLLRAQELGLNKVVDENGWTATLQATSAANGANVGSVSGDGALGSIANGLGNQPGQLAAYSAIETVRDQNGLLVDEIDIQHRRHPDPPSVLPEHDRRAQPCDHGGS